MARWQGRMENEVEMRLSKQNGHVKLDVSLNVTRDMTPAWSSYITANEKLVEI